MVLIPYDVSDVSVWIERPETKGPPEPLPSPRRLRAQRLDLHDHPRLVAWLAERYGLLPSTLREYEIGLDWRPDGPWVTIPIRDAAGALVNVRRRYIGGKPWLYETGRKYRNLTGRGEPRLYPANRLPLDGSRLLVCCGEFDALVFRQVTGLAAVTTTGGASNWPVGWDDLATRFDVTVTYDRGEEPFAEVVARRLGARVSHLPVDLPIGTDLASLYKSGGATALRAVSSPPRRVIRRVRRSA